MMSVVEPVAKQTERKAATRAEAGSKVAKSAASKSEQICWLEVKPYPYQPDHQVELMHLQAEADALLIKLQAKKSQTEHVRLQDGQSSSND